MIQNASQPSTIFFLGLARVSFILGRFLCAEQVACDPWASCCLKISCTRPDHMVNQWRRSPRPHYIEKSLVAYGTTATKTRGSSLPLTLAS